MSSVESLYYLNDRKLRNDTPAKKPTMMKTTTQPAHFWRKILKRKLTTKLIPIAARKIHHTLSISLKSFSEVIPVNVFRS